MPSSTATPATPGQDIPPADLDSLAIEAGLRGPRLRGPVRVAARTRSTMDDLAALADAGAPEGTLVIADEQRAGRGRLGRVWLAPPGTALLASILLRPPHAPALVGGLMMAAGLAALDAVRPHLPADAPAALKWPNDLLAGGLKLGGVLAEAAWPAGRVILGFGLNLSQAADALPPGATSLAALGGRVPDRAALAADLVAHLDGYYGELLAGGTLVERWAQCLATLGRPVDVHGPSGALHGVAIGVAPDGALQVQAADGTVHTVRAGDVTLRTAEHPLLHRPDANRQSHRPTPGIQSPRTAEDVPIHPPAEAAPADRPPGLPARPNREDPVA